MQPDVGSGEARKTSITSTTITWVEQPHCVDKMGHSKESITVVGQVLQSDLASRIGAKPKPPSYATGLQCGLRPKAKARGGT